MHASYLMLLHFECKKNKINKKKELKNKKIEWEVSQHSDLGVLDIDWDDVHRVSEATTIVMERSPFDNVNNLN